MCQAPGRDKILPGGSGPGAARHNAGHGGGGPRRSRLSVLVLVRTGRFTAGLVAGSPGDDGGDVLGWDSHAGTGGPLAPGPPLGAAGRPARWPVERTNSWLNGYRKLRRMTDRNATIVEFYLDLAAALVIIRQLIQRARSRYRWDTRPATKRLK
jgi:hypothetical protein